MRLSSPTQSNVAGLIPIGVVIAIVLAIVVGLRTSEARQQVGTPEAGGELAGRVASLETRVASLEAAVGATPVAALPATPVPAAGVFTFSGTGQTALDPFDLPGGLYKFSGTCDQGFFNIDMEPLSGSEFLLVGLNGSAPYSGSTNVSVQGGRYALSVTCQGNWTVTTEPVR